MADKKDLVEAQAFSRRRLVTAFVSGAPGGRELEPVEPLRAVVVGFALTALLVVGSLVLGLLRPGLPEDWDHNSLVVTPGGSRYVALDGRLYPVPNTTSARLLIEGEYRVLRVDEERLSGTPRGPEIGIPDAPDELPVADRLVRTGWLSCTGPEGGTRTLLTLGGVPEPADTATAVLVEVEGDTYLVTGGRRHLVPRDRQDAVLRAVGQETAVAWAVGGDWLRLFDEGADLEPVALADAGGPLPEDAPAPPGATVGSVLDVTDSGSVYVVDAVGDLVPMTPFALRLYRIGAGAHVGADVEVTEAQIAAMATARTGLGGADWPVQVPTPHEGTSACARLDTGGDGSVALVADDAAVDPDAAVVAVDPAAGALVRSVASPGLTGPVLLVDQSGTTFPVPDPGVLPRLGYRQEDVVDVPQTWVALLPTGSALSVEAAAAPVTAAAPPGGS